MKNINFDPEVKKFKKLLGGSLPSAFEKFKKAQIKKYGKETGDQLAARMNRENRQKYEAKQRKAHKKIAPDIYAKRNALQKIKDQPGYRGGTSPRNKIMKGTYRGDVTHNELYGKHDEYL
jgi:hypothetical protein